MSKLIDPDAHLRRLKDFQKRTVDYVFDRLYLAEEPTRRFLVADEVGLGKTMVARGVVAKTIEHLDHLGVRRIDVVYVCSNAAIAAQNLRRLNVLDEDASEGSFATRLTLLPLHVSGLNDRRVNFISFTPATTFNLRSRGGTVTERAVLYAMLREIDGIDRNGLQCLLRDRAGWDTWDGVRRWVHKHRRPDPAITAAFREAVSSVPELLARVIDQARAWRGDRENDQPWPKVDERLRLVGDLRSRLAELCLDALEPDLIILDEFQRFKDLLGDEGSEQAHLAKRMFDYEGKDGDPPPRVLLLSATPYKMYTVAGEVSDNHYEDLLQTLSFLFDHDGDEVAEAQAALAAYRTALTRAVSRRAASASGTEAELQAARSRIQQQLLRVMVRTERTASVAHRDAMVSEVVATAPLKSADLDQFVKLDRLVRSVGGLDVIEYWKSTPYLVDFMKGYDLGRRMDHHTVGKKDAVSGPEELTRALDALEPHRIRRDAIDAYGELEAGNPRLRLLLEQLDREELWRMLWLPPSLEYLEPGGAYVTEGRHSKALVFSSWNVVPDAIAAVASYHAERSMLGDAIAHQSHGTLSRDRRGLLRFSVSGERFAGMGALLLQYPSPYLAKVGDPLEIATNAGGPVPARDAIELVRQRIEDAIETLELPVDPERPGTDARWYWMALAALDAQHFPKVLPWLSDRGDNGFSSIGRTSKKTAGATGFAQVVARFCEHATSPALLGARPHDLGEVLATVALAGPGVCALRSLRRQASALSDTSSSLLRAAAQVAEGFRTLFNVPEMMGLLGAFERHREKGDEEDDEDYWIRCVQHALDGNLQAVLDEQTHVLRDSLGFGPDAAPESIVRGIADEIADSLSLRTANLFIDDVAPAPERPGWLVRPEEPFSLRTRFGLRLGELKDENKQVQRIDVVRKAFNSPFRPFLLASTSVGQEGLDFHTWCHVVYHWNLPSNPVDMEQREGRVHRYKGLAVRRNLATRYRDSPDDVVGRRGRPLDMDVRAGEGGPQRRPR